MLRRGGGHGCQNSQRRRGDENPRMDTLSRWREEGKESHSYGLKFREGHHTFLTRKYFHEEVKSHI